jgi:hypothetical protein
MQEGGPRAQAKDSRTAAVCCEVIDSLILKVEMGKGMGLEVIFLCSFCSVGG